MQACIQQQGWGFAFAHKHATTHTNTRSTGTARYANGSTYTGEFESDLRVGWGRLELGGDESYEGQWAGHKFHGEQALRLH